MKLPVRIKEMAQPPSDPIPTVLALKDSQSQQPVLPPQFTENLANSEALHSNARQHSITDAQSRNISGGQLGKSSSGDHSGISHETLLSIDPFRPQSAGPSTSAAWRSEGTGYPSFGQAIEIRPVTRPTTSADLLDDSQTSILPPKRDLPFVKPTEKPTTAKADAVTASSSDTIPKKGHKAAAKSKVAHASRQALAKPAIKMNVEPISVAVSSGPRASDQQPQVERLPNRFTNLDSSSAKAADALFGQVGPEKLPISTGPAQTDTSNLQDRIPRAQNETVSSAGPSRDWMDGVDHFVRRFNDQMNPAVLPENPSHALAMYANLPEKERLENLDDMICDLIMDDNFTILCEDVESSWRRIGLGF
ncbi:hypothetical protein MMC09_005467 [Bachmanniomyces sp. S44760]|nr:hypothetical protein [Bachmanniomyces sp. S44760]